jgi:hypothetical protein
MHKPARRTEEPILDNTGLRPVRDVARFLSLSRSKVYWPAPQNLFQSLRESSCTWEGARRTLDVEEAEAA